VIRVILDATNNFYYLTVADLLESLESLEVGGCDDADAPDSWPDVSVAATVGVL
jgi:hypothetical protein